MKFHTPNLALLAALLFAPGARAAAAYSPVSNVELPYVSREFRGVWIATVANIDWPSSPGLPVAQQKAELLAILDRAAKLNLNAVIFQVSPTGDALYDSRIEPWSYYLTGAMGRPPSPYYDPLRFAIDEAHQRGLELHAWFSPYRVGRFPQPTNLVFATNHISRLRPDLVRKHGDLWLDPGEPDVQDYALSVVMEVVRRYDIDGVHFDDRLGYPEPPADASRNTDFPDNATWERRGGNLSRDDWRRENVNTFVRRACESVHSAKPWVKVGIAPFGIWQPAPPQIKGLNSFTTLYTDSRKWLASGWVDYLSPQLYWPIAAKEQSFPILLKWWLQQNPLHRNVWPGLYSSRVGDPNPDRRWKPAEIPAQIQIVRNQCDGAAGEILFSAASMNPTNHNGLAAALASGVFAQPALIPPSPWLEPGFLPSKPVLRVEDGKTVRWQTATLEPIAARWILQTRTAGRWDTRLLPTDAGSFVLAGSPDLIALTAVDRCGVASPPAILQKDPAPAPPRR